MAALLALLLLLPGAALAGGQAADDAQDAWPVESGGHALSSGPLNAAPEEQAADGAQDAWLVVPSGKTFFIGPLAIVPPEQGFQLTQRAVAAPETADGTVAMYEQPHEGSAVLMTYYRGAPLEVIRASVNGFYQVQAGTAEAGVMGYMRGQDVEIGERADREVAPSYMELQFNREAKIYAYCDESAKEIGICTVDHTYYAMGKNDGKWVQLTLPPVFHFWEQEDRATVGFVKLETGMARGYWHEPGAWESSPVTGEASVQQLVELAIVGLTNASTDGDGLPEAFTQRAALERMESRVFLDCPLEDAQRWRVCFWETEGSEAVTVQLTQAENNQWHYWIFGHFLPENEVWFTFQYIL